MASAVAAERGGDSAGRGSPTDERDLRLSGRGLRLPLRRDGNVHYQLCSRGLQVVGVHERHTWGLCPMPSQGRDVQPGICSPLWLTPWLLYSELMPHHEQVPARCPPGSGFDCCYVCAPGRVLWPSCFSLCVDVEQAYLRGAQVSAALFGSPPPLRSTDAPSTTTGGVSAVPGRADTECDIGDDVRAV